MLCGPSYDAAVAREPAFPRLGQFLVNYEDPLKALPLEFAPNGRVVANALLSLKPLLESR